jgi:hypothetical protein
LQRSLTIFHRENPENIMPNYSVKGDGFSSE